MAKITPYDPGEMPNRVVGTPGVDPSAGKGAESISQGLLQARNADASKANALSNAYGNLEDQQAHFLGSVIGKVGHAAGAKIGSILRENDQNRKKQQEQLADLGVVADGHGFAQDAESTYNDTSFKNKDTPELIPGQMQDYLDKKKEFELRKYDDPVQRAKAEANYDGTITSVMNKAGDKSLDMQYAQAKAMAPNMVASATNSITQQTGSIDDRIKNFAAQAQIMSEGIRGMQPQLGQAATEQHLNSGGSDLAAALMNNLVNQRPNDPVEAMQHLTQVSNMLKGSTTMNTALTGDQRHEFAGRIAAAMSSELKEIKNVEVANQAVFSTGVGAQRIQLDLHHDNPELQTQALNWAQANAQYLKGKVEQIDRDPNLPEDAKTIQRESAIEQGKVVDGIVRVAHNNLQYQESLKRAKEAEDRHDAVEARRIKHEAERDFNAAKRQQKEDAVAQLKTNELETKISINDKLDTFEKLAADPTKNRDKLIQLQAEIGFLAKNGRDAGYLDPDKAQSYTEKVNRIGLSTANYKERPQFGFFGPATIVKNKNANDQAKAKAAYEASVVKDLAALQLVRRSDARADLLKISPAGQAEFRKWSEKIQASQLSATAKVSRTNDLLGRILRDYPGHKGQPPPPKGLPAVLSGGADEKIPGYTPTHPAPKFVAPPASGEAHHPASKLAKPPAAGEVRLSGSVSDSGAILTSEKPQGYNGNIDITKRQLVLHDGGKMTPENSTEAARKETGGNAGGDYGTEYSMRFTDGDHEVSIPTIFAGKLHSQKEALEHYHRTHEYLGKWPVGTSEKVMNDYEDRVHSREQKLNGVVYRGPNG